jgi:hypothetical protein
MEGAGGVCERGCEEERWRRERTSGARLWSFGGECQGRANGLSCAGEQAEVKERKIQDLLSTAGMASATMHTQRRRQQRCGLQLQRRSRRKGSSAGEVGDMW